jgi:hypothetical protein
VAVVSDDPGGPVTSTVHAIWREFEIKPDLRLTMEEAMEWLGVDAAEAGDILAAFVAAGLLRQLEDGVYVRQARSNGSVHGGPRSWSMSPSAVRPCAHNLR